jgi:hypothetical protein
MKLFLHVSVTNKKKFHDETRRMWEFFFVGGILCNYGFLIWRWHKCIAILLSSPAELSAESLVTKAP